MPFGRCRVTLKSMSPRKSSMTLDVGQDDDVVAFLLDQAHGDAGDRSA